MGDGQKDGEGNIGVFAVVILFVAALITVLFAGLIFSSGSGDATIPLFGDEVIVGESEAETPQVKILLLDSENRGDVEKEIGLLLADGWKIEGVSGTRADGFIILVWYPAKEID